MISVNVIYAVVLGGALMHATWNALIKGSTDTWVTTIAIIAAAACMAAAILPWLASMAGAAWWFLAGSFTLQLGYMALLARIYRTADMSASYPLMRGTAPLMVTVVSVALLGQALHPGALLGIALLCGGILCMGATPRRAGDRPRELKLVLLNAALIASYTLVDGYGARASGAPLSYTLWLFLLQGVGLVAVGLRLRGPTLLRSLLGDWRRGVIGGVGNIASYGATLWAMTLAPIAIVAALRETGILFGVVIAMVFLHERPGRMRAAGAVLLLVGVVVLRLA